MGYELISKEYINAHSKLILKDEFQYYYYITYDKIKQRKTPSKFHISNPYTIQNIKLWCKLNNKTFELISDTYEGDRQDLKFKCLKEECGENFESPWIRIHQGYGCPYCSGKQVGLSNCLATKKPELASEWHPTFNGDLTPYNVTSSNSSISIWWRCNKNSKHEWQATIYNRNIHKSGCPYCAGQRATKDYNLLVVNPKLASEWDYEKNIKTPEEYCPNSNDYAWWVCKNNSKHKWKAIIANRNKDRGCPYCAGYYASEDYNLLIIYPELCEEWDYEKNNKKPEDCTPRSDEIVWWKCSKNSKHNWEAMISNRTKNNGNGNGCPYCAGHYLSEDYNLLFNNPKLCEEWDYSKNERKPEDCHPMSNEKVHWKCRDCNHEWCAKINDRNRKDGKASGCPQCNESKGEKELDRILTKYDISYDSQYTFDDLRGVGGGLLRFDKVVFWDEEQTQLRILIEYDGIFHYEKQYEDDGYEIIQEHDKRKNTYCMNNNIKLLRIPYWEFDNIDEIVRKILIK